MPDLYGIPVVETASALAYRIDSSGNLWRGDRPINEPAFTDGLREMETSTALDGSRVTAFLTRDHVRLRRFKSPAGFYWWDIDGPVCTPADIERTRAGEWASGGTRR